MPRDRANPAAAPARGGARRAAAEEPQRVTATRGGALDEASTTWLRTLAADGAERDAACARLHDLLRRAAHREVARRAGQLRTTGTELDDLALQAADDAMVSVLGKLGEFRGESRFTTWAYKFVVLEVSSKVARHRWHHDAPTVAETDWSALPDRLGLGPEAYAVQRDLVRAVRRAVEAELTERQRGVFVAAVLDGVPLDVLAIELGSTRGALYKSLFDSRRKIRERLVADGYLDTLVRHR
ncbi:RNA polymerase sigma factor [Cellulomonas alba]|uniref:Sigma-70 family RNA polymerase sigma factor n=1 Tax=Cellulomonas alba TaxID=3053467 RepID=A0ABT7SCB4_9CELL|nr:sigma-70 family RNA polymerase sigma factor [Cellulomonas alba]MDM7853820.1 sigma-70 family RNA polymerase sigma factor [Cellulomonas alba]